MRSQELTPEAMWHAVERKDASYDGQFFFAVTSTGIFCFPSCTCRRPRRENVRFYRSREEAMAAGFRPCKRCLSDLERGKETDAAQMLEQIRRLVDEELPTVTIGRIASVLALSPSYLQRRFRQAAGLPLQQFIRSRRLDHATQLLRQTDLSVLQAATMAGFESSSAFYDAFVRVHGIPPGQYRSTRTNMH